MMKYLISPIEIILEHWFYYDKKSIIDNILVSVALVVLLLLHIWWYKKKCNSGMKKISDCDYDKQNISIIICDTDIP